MDKPIFLTPEGRAKLEAELDHLRTVKRAQIAEAIHSAKEEGDIMENSAYDEAKNEQAFVEGRIMTIEQMLKNAVMIDKARGADIVGLGSIVTVVERGSNDDESFQIVGSAEADPTRGKISNESPVGRALLGKRAGDEVQVRIPDGVRVLKVQDIR
ncbi:MAG: transcription elongation factor GreA [Chloroflexi bacterium]|nr:transcription elongation factor GreA [Chloroflexota bacterium]MBI3740686.1 transcription elongation factor GreA [Chloroflexota bacterium]